MKKLLILIAFIAVFLHFYPQPKVDQWFATQKAMLLQKFSAATDTSVRLKSDKIFTDLTADFKSFTSDEVAYVKQLTSSRDKIEQFYHQYCEQKNYNGNLRTTNLQTVCAKIEPYRSLF